MSDPEGFLTRWSRRKRDVAEEETAPAEGAALPTEPAPAESEPTSVDPASLPPIDSITAESDLSAFFAPGVPGDLLNAALRRAWASDPKIRDFVGLSENSWDFVTPGAIPGFGALETTDEMRRVVAQSYGEASRAVERLDPPPDEATQPTASTRVSKTASSAGETDEQVAEQTRQDQERETADNTDKEAAGDDPTNLPKVDIALQHKSDAPQYAELPTRRAHGRALPK